ncbi:hypothetical protein MRX96_038257 [Rhipicephalus microplus]
MRSVRPCQGELQLARQLHQMWPDPQGRELQTDPTTVCQLRGANTLKTPRSAPRWQEQRKVATVMVSSPTILSRRAVAAAVREEIQEARTFASVVKGHPSPPPPPSGQTNPGASQISSPATPGTAVPGSAAPKALPAATAVPEAAPAAAVTLVAQPAAIVPGGRPAVLTAPMAPPAATLALPPAEPACQIIATLLHTLPSGSEELSGSECRTTVDSEVASTTADMTSSATTGGTDSPSSDEGLSLPGTSPQEVECTLPAPAAEGTTESPDIQPPDDSAAMEVVEEVLTSTATGGNTRKKAPYTAKDFLLTPSAGATPTNRRKKVKKKPDQEATPGYCIGGHGCQPPPNLSPRPPLQWTPQGGTIVQRGVPPYTEGFQVVTTRSARRRARDLAAAAALPVDPAIVGTVLFRPSAPGGTFSGSPRLILTQALSARPGVAAIRVNQKRNIVAADATTRECLKQLLTIKELKGIPVTAKEPADQRTSTEFLHGVDGEPAADSLLPGIQSAVPVLSAAREGRTVTLRFAGLLPPEHMSPFLVRFPVRPARPHPLQCRQCGRHPGLPPVAGAAEGCHSHGIFPKHPLETCSGSGSARGDSGGPDFCERGEGPPFAAPPPHSGQTHCPAPRKSRRQPLQGQQFTGTAAPMALPAATAVPEAQPAAAATLAAQPAAIVPGGQPAGPRLLWPRLLRQ